MTEGHKKAIDDLIWLHKSNPETIALILCGSIARGDSPADSDIDLYLVVKDKEFDFLLFQVKGTFKIIKFNKNVFFCVLDCLGHGY